MCRPRLLPPLPQGAPQQRPATAQPAPVSLRPIQAIAATAVSGHNDVRRMPVSLALSRRATITQRASRLSTAPWRPRRRLGASTAWPSAPCRCPCALANPPVVPQDPVSRETSGLQAQSGRDRHDTDQCAWRPRQRPEPAHGGHPCPEAAPVYCHPSRDGAMQDEVSRETSGIQPESRRDCQHNDQCATAPTSVNGRHRHPLAVRA